MVRKNWLERHRRILRIDALDIGNLPQNKILYAFHRHTQVSNVALRVQTTAASATTHLLRHEWGQ